MIQPSDMIGKCGSCMFFHRNISESNNDKSPYAIDVGLCKRYPPVFTQMDPTIESECECDWWQQPPVCVIDTCGEHK